MRMRIVYTQSGLYSKIRKETLFPSYRRVAMLFSISLDEIRGIKIGLMHN